MKKLSLILIVTFSLFLTWCTNKEYISELEAEIADLEDIIYRCNNQIEDAKYYAWESYEEMQEALEYLETCDHY